MNADLMRGGIALVLVITAALFFVLTHDLLIIMTILLFIAGTAITWRSGYRCLYSFVVGIPLVVTAGESDLRVGVVLLIVLVFLFVTDILQHADRIEQVSIVMIPIILAALGFLIPTDSRVLYILPFFLIIAAGSSLVFIVRNQLLKEHYMREIL
jgi:hypothetical protein